MSSEIIDLGKDGITRPIVRLWDEVKDFPEQTELILDFDDVGEKKATLLRIRGKIMQADYLLEDGRYITMQYNPFNKGGRLLFGTARLKK